MALLIFWNTNGRDNGMAIGHLCREYDVDIVLLAETETGSARLVTEVNRGCASGRGEHSGNCRDGRAAIRGTHPLSARHGPATVRRRSRENAGIAAADRPVPLLIVAAHLPSKIVDPGQKSRNTGSSAYGRISRRRRLHLGHRNTVVIGDLNVNPFEDALTAADGLHGVMDKAVARRPARVGAGASLGLFL